MAHYRVLRNIASNYALVATNGLVMFVLTPILFRYLQPVNFAVLAFAIAVSTLLTMLDLGVASAMIRFVSDLAARGEYGELRRLFSTVFVVFLVVGGVASLVLAGLSDPLAGFFHVKSEVAGVGSVVVAMVGLSLAFQLPGTSARGFLEGLENFHLANGVDIVTQLARAAATLLFVYGGLGLLPIAMLFPAAAFIRLCGMLFVIRWTKVPVWPSLRQIDLGTLQRIRGFASLTFVEDTATRLFSQSDAFLVARLLPLPDLAILVVARRLPWALANLGHQTLVVGYPMVTSAVAAGRRHVAGKFMLLSSRNVLALMLPLAAAMFVWAEVILRLWIGAGSLSGVGVFRAFLVFAVMVGLQESPLNLLYGLGRIRFSSGLSVVTLAVAVGLGTLACSAGGLTALAVVYALIQSIVTILLCYQALKLAALDPAVWLKKAVVPVVLGVVPAVIWLLASYWLLPHTLAGLAISTVLGILLFLALFVKMVSGPERQPWQARLRKLLAE